MPVPPLYINGIQCTFAMPNGRLSISEGSAEDGPRTTLLLRCAWADRWDLVRALRGTCVASNGGLARNPPYALPTNTNMVCVAVGEFEYVGSGANADGSVYAPLASLPAQFACVPWQFADGNPAGQNDASGQAWTVTRIKPSAEVYQPIGGSYYVGPYPSTTPLDEASVGLLRANTEIQVTRKFLPRMPLAATQAATGSVNLYSITYGDFTYVGATLLLTAVESSDPYFDCVGNPVVDLTYTYLGRNEGSWLKVQDRSATWQFLNTKADGTGLVVFPSYDFATLPR